MTPPVLGLLVDRPAADPLVALLSELRRWAHPAVPGPGVGAATAWLATSPRIDVPDDRPAAVWVEDADEAAAARSQDLVLAATERLGALLVPTTCLNLNGMHPITPFVRARWRQRHGLPSSLVAVVGDDGASVDGKSVSDDLVPTLLALVSAAAVTGSALSAALAWATPCVTDAASAASLGAIDGEHVVVAQDRLHEATVLAGDEARAAALGRRGRRLTETRSLRHVAAAVAGRLGLVESAGPVLGLMARLNELDTPAASRVRDRAADALAGLMAGA